MKTITTVFLCCLGIVSHVIGQRDANGALIQTLQSSSEYIPISSPYTLNQQSACQEECTWPDVRALDEINTSNAEAYPWLSPDGLRLYYLNTSSGEASLHMVSRPTTNATFVNSQPLNIDYPAEDQPLSCWLTNDELEMFFTTLSDTTLFYAQRNSLTAPFSIPVEVQLLGDINFDFVAAPSLTSDKSQLFLTGRINGDYGIYLFEQIENLSYEISDTLFTALTTPGQLSKNDSTYYFGMGAIADSELYAMCRDSLNNLSVPAPITDLAMPAYNGQVTTDGSERITIFVSSAYNSWASNDLYIAEAHCTSLPVGVQNIETTTYNIYPNPASKNIQIETNEPLEYLSLFDLHGRLIINQPANQQKINQVDVRQLERGMYFCHLITLSGNKVVAKIIVE